MGKKVGTAQNPRFITSLGTELELNPIGALVVRRWDIEYRKKNPEPQPPMQTLENGEEHPNRNHPDYVKQLETWTLEYNSSQISFLLLWGVRSKPPEEWVYPYPLEVDGTDPKLLWLETILMQEDIEEMADAILSVMNVTEDGLEEAQKN